MLLKGIAVVSAVLSVLLFVFDVTSKIYMIPIIFILSFIGLVFIWIIFCFVCTRFINTKKVCHKHNPFFRYFTNCIIESVTQFLRVNLHVSGTEILPKEKFLLAGNHKSAVDPLLTMGVLRKYNMGFVSKKEIFRIPVIGRLMHKSFCLSLDRENIREEVKTIKQASEFIKNQSASIGIYPEGTRNRNEELMPFMNGAFKIAKKAECPVVVAVIRNPELISKNMPFKITNVYLDFIGVLNKDFIKQHSTKQIGDEVFNMMNEKLKKISAKFDF